MSRQAAIGIEDALAAIRRRVDGAPMLSPWRAVTQPMIDAFAALTEDEQFIHVDPVRAAQTPFGGTVAHGFLTLSLVASLAYAALPAVEGSIMGVNYGFDRIRFVAPVRAGRRVRARFVLQDAERRGATEILLRHAVTVEIESEERPALVADWLTLAVFAGNQTAQARRMA